MFTVAELKAMRHFLRDLAEKMGDIGCNDFNPETDFNPRLTPAEAEQIIALASSDDNRVPRFDFVYVDALVKKIDDALRLLDGCR